MYKVDAVIKPIKFGDVKEALVEIGFDGMKLSMKRGYNPYGYNTGVKIGETAGQSVPNIHIHMIPRYRGDVENPRGGVRGVIPHKQHYVKK